MINCNNISPKIIKKIYLDNYFFMHEKFLLHQSEFISTIYKHYFKDLETANIVLYFSKLLHQSILRKKDIDLGQDISFGNFWTNHSNYIQDNIKITNVSLNLSLPKETTRRKIKKLIKYKVLKKKKKIIYWDPLKVNRMSYDNLVKKNINSLSKLVKNFLDYTDSSKSLIEIEKQIKKNYSFYWYHYLNTQQNYLNIWQKKLNDLELLLVGIECSIHATRPYLKKKNNFEKIFTTNLINNKDNNFSASTISRITGIPRATCLRKLSKLIKLKLIKKDKNLSKYYFDFNNYGKSIINSKINSIEIVDLYSNFFYVIIRSLNR